MSSLRFLYTTDLHGNIQKYEDVLKLALLHETKLIHLGADILPKGKGLLKKQKNFIKGYLKTFYIECQRHGITVLSFFGNDDAYNRKIYFVKSIGEYGDLLDEVPFKRNGYTFKAYGWVPDHPYSLKNGTKLDNKNSKPEKLIPTYIEMPVFGSDTNETVMVPFSPKPVDTEPTGSLINSAGFYEIENLKEYFKHKGTIKDDLKSIRAGRKTIMAIHSPPSHVNLDVCSGFKRVGSESVLHWIEKKQPLLVLCGHIHESYEVTGHWKTMLGWTTIIQPGQAEDSTTAVLIEIEDNYVDAEIKHVRHKKNEKSI